MPKGKKRKIPVRKHPRRKPKGGITTVRKHTREIEQLGIKAVQKKVKEIKRRKRKAKKIHEENILDKSIQDQVDALMRVDNIILEELGVQTIRELQDKGLWDEYKEIYEDGLSHMGYGDRPGKQIPAEVLLELEEEKYNELIQVSQEIGYGESKEQIRRAYDRRKKTENLVENLANMDVITKKELEMSGQTEMKIKENPDDWSRYLNEIDQELEAIPGYELTPQLIDELEYENHHTLLAALKEIEKQKTERRY